MLQDTYVCTKFIVSSGQPLVQRVQAQRRAIDACSTHRPRWMRYVQIYDNVLNYLKNKLLPIKAIKFGPMSVCCFCHRVSKTSP